MSAANHYFISAGEHSGDMLAADLVLGLREKMPSLKPIGIGGASMCQAGVKPLFSIQDLSVMGIAEVAKSVARLRLLEAELLAKLDRLPLAFAILVDFPGFHTRLAEHLRLRNIPVIQYIAPKVWAWGESRVEALRANFDLILGILPFETSFFAKHGIPYRYVGSPLKDRTSKVKVNAELLGLDPREKVVAFLPGSRLSELKSLMPTVLGVKRILERKLPTVQFVMPLAKNISRHEFLAIIAASRPAGSEVRDHNGYFEIDRLRVYTGMSMELMAAADAALVASGTATLECALIGTPQAIVYKMNPLTYELAKRMVRISSVSLVNLVADAPVVKEYLQEYSMEEIANELVDLLENETRRCEMMDRYTALRNQLTGNTSTVAVAEIQEFIRNGSKA